MISRLACIDAGRKCHEYSIVQVVITTLVFVVFGGIALATQDKYRVRYRVASR